MANGTFDYFYIFHLFPLHTQHKKHLHSNITHPIPEPAYASVLDRYLAKYEDVGGKLEVEK